MFSSVSIASTRSRLPLTVLGRAAGALLLSVALATCAPAAAQNANVPQATPKRTATPKPRAHKKKAPELQAIAPVPQPQPAIPETPKWPANEAPNPPSITWDSQGLKIEAANSSLKQIMDDVAAKTGAKVDGLGTDERVFGDYGPGPARDVLSQLLHGSSYNVLMLGDQGQGTPKEITLSMRPKGGMPGGNARPTSQEEDVVEPEPEEQVPPPAIIRPPMGQPMTQPMNQPGVPMTPQQRLEEMQRQQMQMQQQNMQNMPPQNQQQPQ